MPGTTLPPDQSAAISGLTARVERLERRIGADTKRAVGPPPLVFSYSGALTNGVESPPWYPAGNCYLTQARVSLLANATTNHLVDVYVNGAFVQTLTLPSGSKTIVSSTNITVTAGSYVTMKTNTVADSDLSVEFIVVSV